MSGQPAGLDLFGEPTEQQWFIFYARAISYERQDMWPEAEADFRRALELNPEQPQVLNYLGYSLVEKQEKLDEALDMIERAVAARPDSGSSTPMACGRVPVRSSCRDRSGSSDASAACPG